MAEQRVEGHVLADAKIESRDWYAWNDLQPTGPPRFHVVGEVQVPNPGVHALLVPKSPQGINPSILLLDLYLKQDPGIWPQVVVWVPARYDKQPGYYRQVQIFYDEQVIADIPVHDIH
jgi:hypothetical protein